MARRRQAIKREVPADPRYNSESVALFINRIMTKGKKTVAQRIVYDAFNMVEQESKRDAVEIFDQAIRNTTPTLEVKSRRVGGATYQVPVEVRTSRRLALAMRWIIQYARARTGRPMRERLAQELLEASRGQGAAVKRREDTHRMAEANRAFAHYRW